MTAQLMTNDAESMQLSSVQLKLKVIHRVINKTKKYKSNEFKSVCLSSFSGRYKSDEDWFSKSFIRLYMHISATHWLAEAVQKPSPNCDARPVLSTIDLLVIHNISLPPNDFSGDYICDFFLNKLDCSVHPYFEHLRDVKVSAHVLIRRNGEIIQFVPFNQRAWHAGQSSYAGREKCNDFSIGIELEGSDFEPFTDAQYKQLADVTNVLITHYQDLTAENITGHSDIAPGRKTDPGPFFDWSRYRALIQS